MDFLDELLAPATPEEMEQGKKMKAASDLYIEEAWRRDACMLGDLGKEFDEEGTRDNFTKVVELLPRSAREKLDPTDLVEFALKFDRHCWFSEDVEIHVNKSIKSAKTAGIEEIAYRMYFHGAEISDVMKYTGVTKERAVSLLDYYKKYRKILIARLDLNESESQQS